MDSSSNDAPSSSVVHERPIRFSPSLIPAYRWNGWEDEMDISELPVPAPNLGFGEHSVDPPAHAQPINTSTIPSSDIQQIHVPTEHSSSAGIEDSSANAESSDSSGPDSAEEVVEEEDIPLTSAEDTERIPCLAFVRPAARFAINTFTYHVELSSV